MTAIDVLIKKANSFLKKIDLKYRNFHFLSFPDIVQLELTDACNINCIMCARQDSSFIVNGNMSERTFEKTIPFFRMCRHVYLAGHGEPTQHPLFYDIVETIIRHDCCVHVATNGYELSKETAEKFKQHKIKSCFIGLDALDDNIFKTIRGISNRSILDFIDRLHERSISITINVVLLRRNFDDIKNIIERFPFIDHLSIFHPKIYRSELLKESLLFDYNSDEFQKWKKEIIELCNKNNIFYTLPAMKDEQCCCSDPINMLVFKNNGTALACCNAVYSEGVYNLYAGNIHTDSIFSIINHKNIIKFRKAFWGRAAYPKPCRNCPVRFTQLNNFKRY